ncbi:MAG: ABC transporter permease, partial [Pirellulaceae bacterium]
RPPAPASHDRPASAPAGAGRPSPPGAEGKIFGTFIGALILGVIQNGLNMAGVDSYSQMVIYGALILVAVLIDQLKKKVVKPASS